MLKILQFFLESFFLKSRNLFLLLCFLNLSYLFVTTIIFFFLPVANTVNDHQGILV